MEPHAVEMLPIGGATCLFRPANQATSLVNATAAEIFQGLAEGRAAPSIAAGLAGAAAVPADVAARDVAALDLAFRKAGLIGPLACREASPSPGASSSERAESACVARRRTLHYAIAGGPCAAVVIDDPVLRALVAAVLAPLRWKPKGDHAEPAGAVPITAAGSGHGFTVRYAGGIVVTGVDVAAARRAVLQAALLAMAPRNAVAAILHASAAAIGGRALLLGGATGSGKSTLLLALLASGARYIADDFTPLLRDGAVVSPFPVAVSVKSGSWALARGRFPKIAEAPEFALGSRCVRYLDVSSHRDPGTSGIVAGGLLFPRYERGAATRLAPLDPENAFQALMECGSAPVGARPSMRPLIELAECVPSFVLTYSDTGEAVARARAIIGATR